MRRDRPVGDVERLRKIGEVELPLLQQLVEDTEADIRIERLIKQPPLFKIFEIDHSSPPRGGRLARPRRSLSFIITNDNKFGANCQSNQEHFR